MVTSMIELQREVLLKAISEAAGNEFKVLIVDEESRRLIDNVLKEDDLPNSNVALIQQIEDQRSPKPSMDAVYVLTPLSHTMLCLLADFDRRAYRRSFLVWTSELTRDLELLIEGSLSAGQQIADFRSLNIYYYPKEAQLVTFGDPSSFFVLFHPQCENHVRGHLEALAQKIISTCISLEEYPAIKYYNPRAPTHEASLLCQHLASFVLKALENYARLHPGFPPKASTLRPRAVLLITDRTMDLMSPLLHEFTYQAMALDLLDIKDGDKVIYTRSPVRGNKNEETKEVEIDEADEIWREDRHTHIEDVRKKIVEVVTRFREKNSHYEKSDDGPTSINTVKNMLAGLQEYSRKKEALALHLDMATKCLEIYRQDNLLPVASVEQSLATGVDEDYKKPKNLADQIVRLTDEESVPEIARLRLLILYILYRGGLLEADIQKLLAHAKLPPENGNIIYNLKLLGARVTKPLKDAKPRPEPIFPFRAPSGHLNEELSVSRYEPALFSMLEKQIQGELDKEIFPFMGPETEANGSGVNVVAQQSSLRTVAIKPTWQSQRPVGNDHRQRILVFVAGGATYAEARSCYQVSQKFSKDVYLITSHMLTPKLFLYQLGGLSVDKRRLDIPAERPPPAVRAHPSEPSSPPHGQGLPKQPISQRIGPRQDPPPALAAKDASLPGSAAPGAPGAPGQAGKPKKKGEEKKKKKLHFF